MVHLCGPYIVGGILYKIWIFTCSILRHILKPRTQTDPQVPNWTQPVLRADGESAHEASGIHQAEDIDEDGTLPRASISCTVDSIALYKKYLQTTPQLHGHTRGRQTMRAANHMQSCMCTRRDYRDTRYTLLIQGCVSCMSSKVG